MTENPIRVLIADDHALVREGIRRVLDDDPGFDVVAEVADGRQAIARVDETEPDVAILDIPTPSCRVSRLPGGSGTKIAEGSLFLSMHDESEYVMRAVHAGAAGYLLKDDAGPALLRQAVRAVHAGDSFFSPAVATRLTEALRGGSIRSRRPAEVAYRSRTGGSGLAGREQQQADRGRARDQPPDGREPPGEPDAKGRDPHGRRAHAIRAGARPAGRRGLTMRRIIVIGKSYRRRFGRFASRPTIDAPVESSHALLLSGGHSRRGAPPAFFFTSKRFMEDTVLAIPFAERAPVRMRLERFTAPFAVALFVLAPQLVSTAPLFAASPAVAIQVTPQEKPDSARVSTIPLQPILLDPINVTATREEKGIFEAAAPVSVVDTLAIREQKPNNTADIIRDLPGIDVNGVGANQQRPTIRGQRGQRILLLEDGLRLNNARRSADFGELPAIVDVSKVERIEVVRGPASVLYGTDALGGVVNMIANEAPPYVAGDVYRGNLSLSWRDQGDQIWPSGEIFGRSGHVGYGVSALYRNTKDYRSPNGTFGDVSFDDDVDVNDSGVEDQSYGAYLDYAIDERQKIMVKGDFYRANNAGFGYVSNADLGSPEDPTIRLQYPDQKVDRFSIMYRGVDLDTPIFDRFQVSGSYMDNERTFSQDILIGNPFGPLTSLRFENENYTDLEGLGVRAEALKLLFEKHLFTYGGDYYRDDSFNRDQSTSTFDFGSPAPPMVSVDSSSNVPNAVYERGGVFAQVDCRSVAESV